MSKQYPSAAVIAALKQGSIYTKEFPSVADVENFPFPDVQEVVQVLQSDVDLLAEEALLLEGYLISAGEDERSGGGAGRSGTQGGGDDFSTDVPSVGTGWRAGESHGRRESQVGSGLLASTDSGAASNNTLSFEDKQAIAQQRAEAMKDAREKQRGAMESLMDGVQAVMEEADANIQEIRMDTTHFRREIINDKKISGDKILKYFEERPGEKEDHLRKLEEKTKTLSGQVGKQQKQLDQREGQGEVLHQIDFDQLSIENQQFQDRIKTKNDELVFLKQSTMETVQVLNAQTEKLNRLTADQARHSKDIEKRKEELEGYMKEIKKVYQELEAGKQKHINLKLQHEAVKVPKVDDYIQQKAEMYELDKAADNWTRKVEIANGQLSVVRQQINATRRAMGGTGGPTPAGTARKGSTSGAGKSKSYSLATK